MSFVIESLRSLTKMSEHERMAQVAQRNWASVSETLRLLTKNEWLSELLTFLSELLICSLFGKKRAICSKIDEQIPNPAQTKY